MIDFRKAINLIKRNGGFYSNKQDDSYYRTYIAQGYKPMQVRVSNHGTHLRTWYDKDYDPSYAINTCIVYSPNGECNSNVDVDMNIKDEHSNIIGQKKPFEVIQYVYNCQLLNENDSALINKAVQSIWQNKGYKDPLINTQKQAKVYRLTPNNQIEIITENKEYKTNKNMGNHKIRITENELKQIVAESVKRVLKEGTWYGDAKPFQIIYNAADQIVQKLEYVNDDTYEEVGDDYSYGRMYDWAVKVRDDAEYYIRNHSSNASINGGENW